MPASVNPCGYVDFGVILIFHEACVPHGPLYRRVDDGSGGRGLNRHYRSGDSPASPHHVRCAECEAVAPAGLDGWKVVRVDDPELDDAPQIAVYCPACARREFGDRVGGGEPFDRPSS